MRFLPIIERYVLRQIARPMFTALTVGLLVLIAERLVRLLDITMGKKNSFTVVAELLSYWLPHYAGLAAPMGLYIGLIYGLSRMSADSELDAILASGVGLHQLTRPVMVIAAFLAMFALAMFGWAQPYAQYAYRSLLYTINNIDVFYLAEEGVFMQADTRTFMLDKLKRGDNAFERIFLFDYRGKGGSETLTAERGRLVQVENDRRPMLQLQTGVRLQLPAQPQFGSTEPLPTPSFSRFDTATSPLGRTAQQQFRDRNDERELTLSELYDVLGQNDLNKKKRNEMASEFNKRIVLSGMVMVLPFLGVPFAIGRRRAQRAWQYAIAGIILVAFYEMIEQGSVITRVRSTSPLITMWLPLAVMTVFALWRYWHTCFTLKTDLLDKAIEWLQFNVTPKLRRLLFWRTEKPA
ncbi:MAG: LptF/LptG family permease [Hyphomicrobiales bacterium]